MVTQESHRTSQGETQEGTKVSDGPRVRIAPSPTGDPHVGTAYIALFNYAFAKRHGGQFVLRIEDTDQERSSTDSEEAILGALRWLGLDWDEGPDIGGPSGPYRQSERLPIYREAVDRLLASGHAYHCFCTRERLDKVRAEQMQRKENPRYDGHCRGLGKEEVERRLAAGETHVIRLAVEPGGTTTFRDELRGEVSIDHGQVDDQVLMKSDGFPTYHLANVVDDHAMGITHVIRGEEWISSTPKHVLLYEAFGWVQPVFVHLGLLRNADRSKLSKRKNPVSVFYYKDQGYLPETFLNFLGTLGFSIGEDRERFSLEEMIEAFGWSRVSAGGPVFDTTKLAAFNAQDIRDMGDEALLDRLYDTVLSRDRLRGLVAQARERIDRLDDFIPYTSFFFGGRVDLSSVREKFRIKKRSRTEVIGILQAYLEAIEKDPRARSFSVEGIEAFSREFCSEKGWKPRELFTLLRLSSAGRTAAPPLFDTMSLCGKDRVRDRLRAAIEMLQAESDWS